MQAPIIILIGKPNSGKSTLFNAIANKHVSLVTPFAHTTLDYQEVPLNINSKYFSLVDTMGLHNSDGVITNLALQQIKKLINDATLILYVIESHNGITSEDINYIKILKLRSKPTVMLLHKKDLLQQSDLLFKTQNIYGFTSFPTSIYDKASIQSIRDHIFKIGSSIPTENQLKELETVPRVAIIGKTNVGKSTLCNLLNQGTRLIVSELEHTTRHNTSLYVHIKNKIFEIIDTPGLSTSLQKSKRTLTLTSRIASQHLQAIKLASIVVVMLDSSKPITKLDLKTIRKSTIAKKLTIVLLNKYDMVKTPNDKHQLDLNIASIQAKFSSLPVLLISCNTKSGYSSFVKELSRSALLLSKPNLVSISELNSIFKEALKYSPPHNKRGVVPKLKYVHWADDEHKSIVIHGENLQYVSKTYTQYLQKFLASKFGTQSSIITIKYLIKSDKN
ncbi:MAG: 50S ribosome-binding GTPase [Methylacidiphilales bacterium]|nr:50S ribosome-binding GTPase [Candidatus Methylacidiphilales bacterium]